MFHLAIVFLLLKYFIKNRTPKSHWTNNPVTNISHVLILFERIFKTVNRLELSMSERMSPLKAEHLIPGRSGFENPSLRATFRINEQEPHKPHFIRVNASFLVQTVLLR